MKREDFMKYAEREIDNAFRGQRNRMMNLVEQAWAEGKRNAEIDGVTNIVKGVLDNLSGDEPHPRVMTIEEVKSADFAYLEFQDAIWHCAVRWESLCKDVLFSDYTGNRYMDIKSYGDLWRCWDKRPSTELRELTPW